MKTIIISFFALFFCSFHQIKAQRIIKDKISKDIGSLKSKTLQRFADFPTYEKTVTNADGTKTKVKAYLNPSSNPNSVVGKRNKVPKPTTKVVSTEKGNGWVCQTSKVKVSLEDDSFMNTYKVDKAKNIVPGTVYTFENFFEGKFNEERSPRNPIRISSFDSGITGDIHETVDNPSKIDNRDAWNKIVNRTAINKNNAGYASKIYMTSSESEMLTSVGFGASGYGAEINMGFSKKATEFERYFMIDATQEMFAATAELPTEGVFVNPEDNKKTGLMFLQSVVYGMRALVSVKMSFSSKEAANEIAAKYNGFGFGAEINLETLEKHRNSSTEIKMYIIGGENAGYVNDDVKSIKEALNTAFKGLTNKNAAPLYFTFVNMNNEAVKTSSATDEFTTRQCIPVAPDAPDENLRFYDVSVTFDNIEETNKAHEEKSIGFRIDAGLYLNNNRILFDNQKKEKFYTPLIYLGDREGLDPKEMTNKWGKPDNGKLNFTSMAYKNLGSGHSLKTRLTKGQIESENAFVKINIPILADYMGPDDWQFYDKMFKDIPLSGLINTRTKKEKIVINHNDGKSYTFTFTVNVELTSDYAEPPKPQTVIQRSFEIGGGKVLKKEANTNSKIQNYNIKKRK